MKTVRRWTPIAALAFVAFLSASARAAEPKVRLTAEVILASNKGNTIDPPALAKMKEEFTAKGFSFTSYRRLSSEKVSLHRKPVEVKLPNRRTATLRLDEIKSGTATVRVDISHLASTTLSLGREGSLFQHAGEFEDGQLILVLSPDEAAQPRRVAGGSPPPYDRGSAQDAMSLTPDE
ncbi:MAG TPA: hypothetical protein VKE49_02900 [Myxococcaceae bacterium]|nr:hypothetical protein [Myxococcaceae bacterium]